MLTSKEAYDICKRNNRGKVACAALEYEDYYLFSMRKKSDIGKQLYTGTCVDAINKHTGKHLLFDLLADKNVKKESFKPIELKELGL